MFSSRLPAVLAPNSISRAAAALRSARVPVLDLTETNPSMVGLACPPGALAALANPEASRYAPEPFGLPAARAAVAADYLRAGHHVDPDAVVLTASTSEAYALLFKLLCDPADEVLIPQPSYPLFESLTRLEAVTARPYRLDFHGAWSIDRESVDRAWTTRTRAVLVVSPNNPTGSILRRDDRDWLASRAAERGSALISDEVFADYPLRPARDGVSLLGEARALTFVLGGLSKSAGLPQVKLGWLVAGGPAGLVHEAMARLEVICDTFLSVSTPVQVAAPALIDAGRDLRARIQARIAANLASLDGIAGTDSAVSVLPPEGGWSVVLRVPATTSEEALVLRLLDDAHVLVHPGYFFDFAGEAFLVASLLPEPAQFEEAMRRLVRAIGDGRIA
jgi:aspartate/methionine/tyrosine aminotransferase